MTLLLRGGCGPRAGSYVRGRRRTRRRLGLLEDRRAVGAVRTERSAALQGLLELVGLPVVLQRAREVHAVSEPGRPEREPRIDAIGSAVDGAVLVDLGLSPEVAHHAPLPCRGAVRA